MRKVSFKKFIPVMYEQVEGGKKLVAGTGKYEIDFYNEGLFHSWGNACEEHENGFGNYSIALVEDKTGIIHEVLPSKIRFEN